ncbi:MAG: phosphoribosyl-AMP cyclohydrolase [Betaproteobacteria bacterium]|nr:phosphoribosyl-AMP cyclohydrolase [Betaproteobacteria bacterium]
MSDWIDSVHFNEQGLVTAIAQDHASGRILMVAFMNQEALRETVQTGRACYFSRSRGRLWRKGEESGHVQTVHSVHLDCDGDAVVLKVTQAGGIACHTGRESCFFSVLENGQWKAVDPVLKDPNDIYRSK